MKQSIHRRWTMLWVLGFLAATAMGFQAAPDEEAGDETVATVATLDIVEQSPTVADGESFVIRVLAVGLDTAELTVDVAVFPAAEGPEPQLEPADQAPLLSSDDSSAAAGAEVIVSSNGQLSVRIPVGTEVADGELALPAPGVYPLRLSLTDGRGVVATTTTTLLYRAEAGTVSSPATVGLVLDVGDGALSVADVTDILAEHEDLAATVVVHRDAVTDLEGDDEAGLAFRRALGLRPVIVGTSTPLDPAALVEAGQSNAYRAAHEQMRERMQALDITIEARATIIDAPLTAAGAELLTDLGFSTAVAHRLATPGSGEPWPVTSGMVDGGAELFVIGTDVGTLTATAAANENPVAQLHGLLAQLALADDQSPLVGELARIDEPEEVVAVLAEPSLSSLWSVLFVTDARFQQGMAGSVVALRTAPSQDLAPSAPALTRIEDLLGRYEGFHADGPRSPGHYRTVLTEAFRVDVAPATRADTLGRVESELIRAFELIDLPGNQAVTLAAQSAPLPVAVENSADGARFVRVQVTSDKISMADPNLVLRVEPGMSAVDVPVRTRSLGASPLTVTLLTPDGSQVLSTTRFQVRSTAVPGLGLLISAIGLGALLAWWYVSVRRSRRGANGDDDHRGGGGPDGDPGPRPDREPPELAVRRDPIDLRPVDGPTPALTGRSQVRLGDSV